MTTPTTKTWRASAIEAARSWAALDALIIDTESTGVDNDAQIVEIAVVNLAGRPILNTLVKPTCAIGETAAAIHGITEEMLVNAPGIADVWPLLRALFNCRMVLSYGANFDFRLIRQSMIGANAASRADLEFMTHWNTGCILTAYADYYGEWSEWHKNNKFQKLTAAGQQCGIKLEGKAHGALYDAQLARLVLLHMAAQVEEVVVEPVDQPGEDAEISF